MAKLTPAGAIGKWVFAPLALILIGYYVVGPRIGKSAGTDPKERQAASSDRPASPSSPAQRSENKSSGPDVAVTVQKTGNSELDQPTKPRRHRSPKGDKKPAVADSKPPTLKPDQASAPPDEGGSAGSTTAGGQT